MDMLDKIAESDGQKINTQVGDLGGDMLDKIAINTGELDMLSQSFADQPATPDRRAMVEQLNSDLSMYQRIMIPIGRGVTNLARGVGLAEPEDPATTEAYESLRAPVPTYFPGPGGAMIRSPIESFSDVGEIFGEALPFLPAGIGASGIKSLAMRVLANAGLGAAEGGIIASGRGADPYETGITATLSGLAGGLGEAFIPAFISRGRALYNRVRGRDPQGPLLTPQGTPTPDFQAALDEAGVRFEDLTEEAFARVNVPNVRPEDAARAARFESQGIPATRGDITQDFAQQAEERRLMGSAVADSGAEFRDLKVKQSRAFEDSVGRFVDDLGIPQEAGDSIKAGLMGRKKAMVREKNAFYRMAGEVDDGSLNIPLFQDNLLEALPDAAKARRIGRLVPTQKDALDDLLVEFGLDTSEEAVEAFDGQIMNLTVGNFNEFRAAINQIERSDQTGAISVLTGPIKEALDKEVKLLDTNLKLAAEKTGKEIDDTAIDLVRKGNKATLDLKTEFDPKRMTSILIDNATKSTKPKVESSKVVEKLLTKGTPVEEVRRVVGSLAQAGDNGTKAIQDLRAHVVLNALENSMKAPSRQLDGQQLMGGAAFAKYLDNVGDDKLKAIFGTDELARLKALKQSALDIEGSALAAPKGSADVNMDIVRATVNSGMFGRALAQFASVLKHFSKPVVDARATQRALNNSPRLLEQTRQLADAYPSLATVLGVPTALAIYDGEEDE